VSAARLTSGRLLARNTVINLAGQGASIALALVCIPLVVAAMGTERFGTLTLVWSVIGYFSVLDLGLGWAVSQSVAEKLGGAREDEIPAAVWTTLAAIFALGLCGTALALAGAEWLVRGPLDLSGPLAREAVVSIRVLALSLPFVATTACMRGLLEARQWFGASNALRIPLALINFAAPLAVLPFSRSLVPVVAVLAAGRVLLWPAHLWAVLRALPVLRSRPRPRWSELKPLLSYGGWTTVSNVVNPVMTQLDRFLIGGLVSVAAVAYYATPYEVVAKMIIVPAAVGGVVFPAFAASYRAEPARAAAVFERAVRGLLAVLLPMALVVVALAREGLGLWLGPEFAANGALVAQVLAVGFLVNGLAQMPFTLLQGVRRPDLTARLHLAEAPLYVALLWLLASRYGAAGAAVAWTLRVTVDAAALFTLGAGQIAGVGATVRRLPVPALVAGVLLAAAAAAPDAAWRLAVVLAGGGAWAAYAWRALLDDGTRAWLRGRGRLSAAPDGDVAPASAA
jgi:O-antigen/teichoic acid export membrane protein